jgi:hypothetical protein
MKEVSPTEEELQKLYEVSMRLKDMAPWEWMEETDVFGVQDPETKEIGFVSIMGGAGEHFAVTVYLGAEALASFWSLQEEEGIVPERVLEIPQLQASFEDRSTLEKPDLDTIKRLGLKFRGKNAWPQFRSFRPGFFPWYLEGAECRFLAIALEQTLDVAPRSSRDASLLQPAGRDEYLIRTPRRHDGSYEWGDSIMQVLPPLSRPLQIRVDIEELSGLQRPPQSKRKIEMDFFMLPSPIQEGDSRPFFLYMLMGVESKGGLVVFHEVLKPETSLEALRASIPETLVHLLAGSGMVPGEIKVRSSLLRCLLEPLAQELSFKLKQVRTLPSLDPAKASLLQSLDHP